MTVGMQPRNGVMYYCTGSTVASAQPVGSTTIPILNTSTRRFIGATVYRHFSTHTEVENVTGWNKPLDAFPPGIQIERVSDKSRETVPPAPVAPNAGVQLHRAFRPTSVEVGCSPTQTLPSCVCVCVCVCVIS